MPLSCGFPKNLRNRKEDVLQRTMKRASRSAYGGRTGIHWKALPRGWGASSTGHDRVQQGYEAGGFHRLCTGTLGEDEGHQGLQGLSQGLDGAMTKASPGGKAPGPHPTARGKRDTKRHGMTQGAGLPISAVVTGANRLDKPQVERTHRGLKRFRRILSRWEKKVENYMAFLQGATAHICMRAGLACRGMGYPFGGLRTGTKATPYSREQQE